jgi:hypothetical protein
MVLTGRCFVTRIVVCFLFGAVSGWLSNSSDGFRETVSEAFPNSSTLLLVGTWVTVCCFSALGVTAGVGFLLAISDRWRLVALKIISTGILLLILGFGAGVLAESICGYAFDKPPSIAAILASVVFLVSGFVASRFAIARLFPDEMLGSNILKD